MLSFVGRTFVALGGAYLLRALTDAAVVPLPQGTALGLAYAAGWLAMSDRAGAANRRTSAVFHGLVATIIAVPVSVSSRTRGDFSAVREEAPRVRTRVLFSTWPSRVVE